MAAKRGSGSVLNQLLGRDNKRDPANWGSVKGPIFAAKMSARRIDWSLDGPFAWRDDKGRTIDLRLVSPLMLK